MPIHFLAYGHADQTTFRDPNIWCCFDGVVIPGTIATYYQDSTGGFVLTLNKPFVIDPRTPLFQTTLSDPKGSHKTLARIHGEAVYERVGQGTFEFSSSFYSPDVVRQLTRGVIAFQQTFSRTSTSKADRYARLLAEAKGQEVVQPIEAHDPRWIVLPYFVTRDTSDTWWQTNQEIWNGAFEIEDMSRLLPVVACQSATPVGDLLEICLSRFTGCFLWLNDFKEHEASVDQITSLIRALLGKPAGKFIFNLYGGYLSVLLSKFGLDGFNNGIGYSESRSFPELQQAGGPRPRYYMPKLHKYLSLEEAQILISSSPDKFYDCVCDICRSKTRNGRLELSLLGYHELMKHFVLARRREIEFVRGNELPAIIEDLRASEEYFTQNTLREISPRIVKESPRLSIAHLTTWARVLEDTIASGSASP